MRKSFLKKANEIEGVKIFKQVFAESANYQNMKQKVWNPYIIIFGYAPLFIMISPFILPISIASLIKKLTGYKTKLEKKAEAETKSMEERQKKNDEWMRTEGEVMVERQTGERLPEKIIIIK